MPAIQMTTHPKVGGRANETRSLKFCRAAECRGKQSNPAIFLPPIFSALANLADFDGNDVAHYTSILIVGPLLHHLGPLLEIRGVVVSRTYLVPLLMCKLQFDVGMVKPHLVHQG